MISELTAGFMAMSTGMLRRMGANHSLRTTAPMRSIAVIGADVQIATDKRERKNVKRACAWTGARA